MASRTATLPAEVGFLLHLADELTFLPAALLAGLLVERRALDVARQAFLLAGLLESLEELVETLVHPDFDADQALTSFRFRITSTPGIIARTFAGRQQNSSGPPSFQIPDPGECYRFNDVDIFQDRVDTGPNVSYIS